MDAFKNFYNARYKKELFEHLGAKNINNKVVGYFTSPSDFPSEMAYRQRVAEIGDALFLIFKKDFKLFYDSSFPFLKAEVEDKKGRNPFFWEPFSYVIQKYGLKYFELSMSIMEPLTELFTAEFAIRPFIEKDAKKTLIQLNNWSKSSNEHLRRLASEGSRPRLPWGQNLKVFMDNPEMTAEILERLNQDSSLYVRKSVANHMNDHSWYNEDYFYSVIERWNRSKSKETQWIIKHALRSEIKKANPRALKLIGIAPFKASCSLSLPTAPRFQEDFNLVLELRNETKEEQSYLADLQFVLPGKNSTRKKVFKGWSGKIGQTETLALQKKLSLKDNSIRTYYHGEYLIELLLNGTKAAEVKFTV